jgi:hypothetical protein
MCETQQIVLVLATCEPIDRAYRRLDRQSPFWNVLKTIQLGLLDAEGAEALVAGIAREADLGADDADLLRRRAGRHPFYLKLLGHCLVRKRREGQGTSAAEEEFCDQARSFLEGLWASLDADEQRSLKAAAEDRPLDPRVVHHLQAKGLLDGQALFGDVLRLFLLEDQ